jgi:benzoate/toluate 1,2-dioxygenase reductase component
MNYQVALQFEDGVTRMIECAPGEKLSDAAYRQQVNIPMDCRDGACGTCRGHCESGEYDMPESTYIEDALTPEEAAQGYVLACQMKPKANCVVQIPASSAVCKAGAGQFKTRVEAVNLLSPTTIEFSLNMEGNKSLAFLPGQYAKVGIPGTSLSRAYSFSSISGDDKASFVVRNVPQGKMSEYLTQLAKAGDEVTFEAPFGSFYLRPITRPALFLAGGTGIAPFLSMLGTLTAETISFPVQLVYGVTKDEDLVGLEALEEAAARLPKFSFKYCILDTERNDVLKGYVTQHVDASWLGGDEYDTYLCGPVAMVDAVRKWQEDSAKGCKNFYFEKFSASTEA